MIFRSHTMTATIRSTPRASRVSRARTAWRSAMSLEYPNGSVDDIAGGLPSENRRVLGMMPHPERAIEPQQGGADGAALFRAVERDAGNRLISARLLRSGPWLRLRARRTCRHVRRFYRMSPARR